MPTITLTFDPTSPPELAEALRTLRLLSQAPEQSPSEPTSLDEATLHERITALIAGYGEGRRSYLGAVAEASPNAAPYAELAALFDSPKAIGGTHSSIERSWRGMGASTDLIHTGLNGNSSMPPEAAAMVLRVLQETSLPAKGGS